MESFNSNLFLILWVICFVLTRVGLSKMFKSAGQKAVMAWKDEALDSACKRIVHAVTQYPELIAGTKRYCTDLMRVTKGRIVGKTGADGVYCLSIPEKNWGIAIKVDDGKMGPQYQVAHGVLCALGLLQPNEIEALKPHGYCENLNFAGNLVGYSDIVPLNCPV